MEFRCGICFNDYEEPGSAHSIVGLSCGHMYGKECIEQWFKASNNSCPKCKKKIPKRSMYPIFDIPEAFYLNNSEKFPDGEMPAGSKPFSLKKSDYKQSDVEIEQHAIELLTQEFDHKILVSEYWDGIIVVAMDFGTKYVKRYGLCFFNVETRQVTQNDFSSEKFSSIVVNKIKEGEGIQELALLTDNGKVWYVHLIGNVPAAYEEIDVGCTTSICYLDEDKIALGKKNGDLFVYTISEMRLCKPSIWSNGVRNMPLNHLSRVDVNHILGFYGEELFIFSSDHVGVKRFETDGGKVNCFYYDEKRRTGVIYDIVNVGERKYRRVSLLKCIQQIDDSFKIHPSFSKSGFDMNFPAEFESCLIPLLSNSGKRGAIATIIPNLNKATYSIHDIQSKNDLKIPASTEFINFHIVGDGPTEIGETGWEFTIASIHPTKIILNQIIFDCAIKKSGESSAK
uniref:RING-type domain-containing protein n=1 Tax=Rhabditophanes sp. KR3021 TaxID=114890 RepID=A0AC35TLM0_9BILA